MKPTLKLLLNRIEAWCDDHAIITEFGHGLLPDLEKGNKRSEWVMVYLVIQDPTIFDYGVDFSFDFIVLAPTEVNPESKDADMESLKQVQSDLLQIIQDFLAEVKNGTSYFYKDGNQIFDIADQPVRALPFVEEFDQVLTGWNAPITIQVNDPLNQCDIPYIGAFDPPSPVPCDCDPATILEPSTNGYGIELAGVQVGDPFGTPTSELASGFSGVLGTQITIYIKGSSGSEITDGQRAYILGLNQGGVFDLTVDDIRINNSEGTSIAVAGIDGATLVPSLDGSGDETGVYRVLFIPSVVINDSRMISSDYVEVAGFPVGGYYEDILATAQELHPDVVVEDSGANSQTFPWRGPGSYEVDDTEQKHTDGSSFSTPRTGPALADKNLPAIIITDSTDGDAELYNGGSQGGDYDDATQTLTFSVTPAGGITPSGRLYMEAPKGGQTSTIYTGDEGWLEANSHQIFNPTRPTNPATIVYLTDFYTLGVNNIHGNTLRFTTTAGAGTSGWVSGTYVWQDHAYGKLYRYDDVNQPLADHFADAAAATWEGKSAGDWAVCPVKLLHTMADGQDSLRPFSNIPIRPANIGTSSISQHITGNCFNILNGSNNNLQINTRSATSNNRVVYVTNI